MQDMLHTYLCVVEQSLPNFLGARVPLPTNLHIQQWEAIVVTPADSQVIQMVTFGFLVGYTGPIPTPMLGKHPSANNFPAHLDMYISKELGHVTMLGPFHTPSSILGAKPTLFLPTPRKTLWIGGSLWICPGQPLQATLLTGAL